MTKEEHRKQLSETVFKQWSGAARAYAGRPERKKVESKEVEKCQLLHVKDATQPT